MFHLRIKQRGSKRKGMSITPVSFVLFMCTLKLIPIIIDPTEIRQHITKTVFFIVFLSESDKKYVFQLKQEDATMLKWFLMIQEWQWRRECLWEAGQSGKRGHSGIESDFIPLKGFIRDSNVIFGIRRRLPLRLLASLPHPVDVPDPVDSKGCLWQCQCVQFSVWLDVSPTSFVLKLRKSLHETLQDRLQWHPFTTNATQYRKLPTKSHFLVHW